MVFESSLGSELRLAHGAVDFGFGFGAVPLQYESPGGAFGSTSANPGRSGGVGSGEEQRGAGAEVSDPVPNEFWGSSRSSRADEDG